MANPIDTADGWVWNKNSAAYPDTFEGSKTFNGSTVRRGTSQITHNGPFVQEQMGEHGRSDVVRSVQLQDGHGRLVK
jgi:hypothetical protein